MLAALSDSNDGGLDVSEHLNFRNLRIIIFQCILTICAHIYGEIITFIFF